MPRQFSERLPGLDTHDTHHSSTDDNRPNNCPRQETLSVVRPHDEI